MFLPGRQIIVILVIGILWIICIPNHRTRVGRKIQVPNPVARVVGGKENRVDPVCFAIQAGILTIPIWLSILDGTAMSGFGWAIFMSMVVSGLLRIILSKKPDA